MSIDVAKIQEWVDSLPDSYRLEFAERISLIQAEMQRSLEDRYVRLKTPLQLVEHISDELPELKQAIREWGERHHANEVRRLSARGVAND